jgi:hypothetical protein
MENKYYPLGNIEKNGIVRIIRIVFGVVCIAIAAFWLVFNIRSLKADGTLWITIIFLWAFGLYQIWAGFGKANRFIEFGSNYIRLRKNTFFAPRVMNVAEIEKIELFPMNLVFFLKTGKRIMLRFGATYQDLNEKIKDDILIFVEINKIPFEIVEEKI